MKFHFDDIIFKKEMYIVTKNERKISRNYDLSQRKVRSLGLQFKKKKF